MALPYPVKPTPGVKPQSNTLQPAAKPASPLAQALAPGFAGNAALAGRPASNPLLRSNFALARPGAAGAPTVNMPNPSPNSMLTASLLRGGTTGQMGGAGQTDPLAPPAAPTRRPIAFQRNLDFQPQVAKPYESALFGARQGTGGGDAHAPAGTGYLDTASRIGQYQSLLQNADSNRFGNWSREKMLATMDRGAKARSKVRGTGLAGSFAQAMHNLANGSTLLDGPENPVPAGGGNMLGDTPPGVSEVGSTIDGDRPIYDQNFIQHLTNRAAEEARLDPREALKRYDIPGLSRDEGQFAAAIPDMANARAAANLQSSMVPLQAEIANRMYQLEGQGQRGNEALSLANIIRQLQGAQDYQSTAMLGAVLDPLMALLTR